MNLDRLLRPARKILTAAVVTLVTAAGVTVAAPSTATAATPAVSLVAKASVFPAYSDTYYEQGVQYWVNRVRKQHGLRALGFASCADGVAENWSTVLATTNSFYHQSMTKLLSRCHAFYAGETLGRGSITPRTLVTMWMHSPPHRAVLMSRSPNRIGIGATPSASGEWVVAANFLKL
ncbi:MAG: CAP domain-containing protein [Nocardioidaceae bacterium]